MDRSLLELVEPNDMIGVSVSRDRDQVTVEFTFDERPQRSDPHAGVDDEAGVAPLHVPHVAAQERMDVRFGDERDAVADAQANPPDIRDR